MSTVQTSRIESTSSDKTELLGEKIGAALKGGEVIELVSDLGGGKTTFVRGLARGFGSADRVASPTFTISKVYKSGDREIQHFDFYRLSDAGLAAYELHDVIGDPEVVVVIEWGQVVSHVLPEDKLSVSIARTGDDTRAITLTYPQRLAYVVSEVV